MEKQLLPNAALRPVYDKIVWIYVYRDFSKSEADLQAERISLRFGVTSWPQLLLVDPDSLRVLGSTGRTAPSFLRAVNSTSIKASASMATANRVRQADARAAELEQRPAVALAKSSLDDEDIVVRYRALSVLAEKDPITVATRAESLLNVPSDPFRYEVCNVLAKTGNSASKLALEKLVRRPVHSRNPNVLRIRAVEALGSCGDGESIEVLESFTRGSYLNMLTKTTVGSLGGIAKRHPETRNRTREILIDAFPVPSSASSPLHSRYCIGLAKTVHSALQRLTNTQLAFPEAYTPQTRRELIESWKE